MTLPPPLVSVIIPCHQKDATIVRAIESVKQQTLNNLSCIIVNDSSTDDSESVILAAIANDARFSYKKVDFRNVALTRNFGADNSEGQFLCFLDGDDFLEPNFLEVVIEPLLQDRSLGIGYSALRWHKPDGTTGVSEWPKDFDYDRQLKKQNQISTCSIIRRECWMRLGGQNPVYCGDGGAGAEDGEFYLRAGAFGWGAKKATRLPLFNYSMGTGIVTGDPNYVEPDWTELWPWAGNDSDGRHPFASVATPKRFSHLVSQYDEPVVSVIIPVGPGHEKMVRWALDSLEHQTMRKWEAIVVDDTEDYEKLDDSLVAYPYVRRTTSHDVFTVTSGVGLRSRGAGRARNEGAKIARAPFLVFLDADDKFYPKCLERMLEEWNETQTIIYTDYVGKTYIENPADLDPALQERMYYYDEKNKEAVIGHRAAEYECSMAQEQPRVDSRGNIYVWTNVTALIPKAWHNEIGGFDEKMPSWEDIDYHWRLARAGKCYTRIAEELMVYQMHTGHRRERGRQEYPDLLYYLKEKYEEVEVMPCSGCPGRRRSNPAPAKQAGAQAAVDSDMVLIKYIHPNKGSHPVLGAAQFERPPVGLPTKRIAGTYRINYGYRKGGGVEEFYAHKDDIVLVPHLFLPIEKKVVVAVPVEDKGPQPPPERIVSPEPAAPTMHEATKIASPEPSTSAPDLVDAILERAAGSKPFDLQTLPGIGGATAQLLVNDGVQTKEDVIALGVEGLAQYRGIGEIKAEMIMEAIEALG